MVTWLTRGTSALDRGNVCRVIRVQSVREWYRGRRGNHQSSLTIHGDLYTGGTLPWQDCDTHYQTTPLLSSAI